MKACHLLPGTVLLALALVAAARGQEPAEEPPPAPLGAPAAFDLTTEASPRLAVPVGLRLYAQPSLRAAVVGRVRFATELEIVERRDGWARVRYEGRQLWVAVEPVAGSRLPPPRLAEDRLAAARRCLGREQVFDLGPFPLYTDLEDEDLLADLVRLGRQVPEAFVGRYGVRPEPVPAALVLVAGEEDYLACRRALGAAEVPGEGYLEGGLAVFPAGDRQPDHLRARLVQDMGFLLVGQALGGNLPDWLREGLAYDLAYGRIARDGTFAVERLHPRPIEDARYVLHRGAFLLEVTQQLLAPRSALKRLLREWEEPQRPTVAGVLELGTFRLLDDDGRAMARALWGFLMRYLLADPQSAAAQRLKAFLAAVAAGGPADGAAFLAALDTTPEELETGLEAWLRETARRLRIDLGASGPTGVPTLDPAARRVPVEGG